MGTDIHMYCEMKKNNKFISLDYFKINEFYSKDNPDPIEEEYECIPIYKDRCYSFFGVLAGVRDNSFKQICDCRGIPEDTNEYIKKSYERWVSDAHSASWITLRELIDYYNWITDSDYKFLSPFAFEFDYETIVSSLKRIVRTLEDRVCEHEWIYYENRLDKERQIEKYLDYVRIVFWFDC